MNAAHLRAQAERRKDAAVAEGLVHMANGWHPGKVLDVLRDAAGPIGELRDQADAVEEIEVEATKRQIRLRRFLPVQGSSCI